MMKTSIMLNFYYAFWNFNVALEEWEWDEWLGGSKQNYKDAKSSGLK
jgi:hypothetical protein